MIVHFKDPAVFLLVPSTFTLERTLLLPFLQSRIEKYAESMPQEENWVFLRMDMTSAISFIRQKYRFIRHFDLIIFPTFHSYHMLYIRIYNRSYIRCISNS